MREEARKTLAAAGGAAVVEEPEGEEDEEPSESGAVPTVLKRPAKAVPKSPAVLKRPAKAVPDSPAVLKRPAKAVSAIPAKLGGGEWKILRFGRSDPTRPKHYVVWVAPDGSRVRSKAMAEKMGWRA